MSNKVWNLNYALGNTNRETGDALNPLSRKAALEGAAVIAKNGWRVWVEHHASGHRIYQSPPEVAHRAAIQTQA